MRENCKGVDNGRLRGGFGECWECGRLLGEDEKVYSWCFGASERWVCVDCFDELVSEWGRDELANAIGSRVSTIYEISQG